MLLHKLDTSKGFTIAELMMVVIITSVAIVVFNSFFSDSLQSYLNLQNNTVNTNTVSGALQRSSRVIRGMSTIVDAQPNILTGFAYFTPRDNTLSKVRYYYESNTSSFKVGVTPATGSAPNYTYDADDEIISTIADNITGTGSIFTYLDGTNTPQNFTSDAYKDIRAIKISLTGETEGDMQTSVNLSTTVSLRNRKTNL
jgi:hypothetical protein